MRLLSLAATMLVLAASVVAQAPPTAQNVIPDGISFTTEGTVEAIDPAAETLTVVPKGQAPVSMVAAPGVSLAGIKQGDFASVHYTRHVTFTIGNANAPATATPTATVGQGARDPNAIATNGGVFVARVVKINGPDSIDVVNNDGGGIYTIKTTQPAREAIIAKLKVGDSITVSVSPILATSVATCGLFGKGLFGC
jgi:hypothetical protein